MKQDIGSLKHYIIFIAIILSTTFAYSSTTLSPSYALKEFIYNLTHCAHIYDESQENVNPSIFVLYNVNPAEGFNLRRDVYIRLAVFIKQLQGKEGYKNVKLVLPPFLRLYHWRSQDIEQNHIQFWNHFFDLASLQRFANVIDIWQYFNEIKTKKQNLVHIDRLIQLQNFPNLFENGKFVEKYYINYTKSYDHFDEKGSHHTFGYGNFSVNKYSLVSYQGSVQMLHSLMNEMISEDAWQTHYSLLFLNAEVCLHDYWGNYEFWMARRSMRFNEKLVNIATKFRKLKFNSTNQQDLVQSPSNWIDEKPYRNAIGGKYICAHLRRGDFLYGREHTVPTLRSAAQQIKNKLNETNLKTIFISSDCNKQEFKDLKSHLGRYKVVRYTPESLEEKTYLKDGGIAIIDQIICSHAQIFIGTYESTFTYRIYEEREILGFQKTATFNTFCKNDYDNEESCRKNSVWPIQYD